MRSRSKGKSGAHVISAPLLILICLAFLTMLYDKGINSGLPLYYDGLGYPAATGGMLVAIFTLTSTISRLLGGVATDRFSHIRVLMVSMIISLAGVLIPSIWDAFPVVVACCVLQGCGFALASNVISVLVQSIVPKGHIGEGAGLQGAGSSLGMMFGAAVATFSLDSFGFRGFFLLYVAVIVLCIIGVIALPHTKTYKKALADQTNNKNDTHEKSATSTRSSESPEKLSASSAHPTKKPLRQFFIPSIVPYVGVSFLHRFIRGLCVSFILVYAAFSHIGSGPAWFIVSGFTMLIMRLFGGKFYDKAGPWWLFPMVAINVVGFLLLVLWPNAATFYASAVFLGISIGSSSAFLRTLTAKAAPKEEWGHAVGELLFFGDIGIAGGAYIGGVLLDVFGKAAFPQIALAYDVIAAVATFFVLLFGLRRNRNRSSKS